MKMDNERILRALRTMAWEKAKGELRAMLHTYYSDMHDDDDKFEKTDKAIKEFIISIEDQALHE